MPEEAEEAVVAFLYVHGFAAGVETQQSASIAGLPEPRAHSSIYDRILVGDARELLPALTERYELAIAADILEHFDHGGGVEFLAATLSVADVALISTPSFLMEQQSDANPIENHRSW